MRQQETTAARATLVVGGIALCLFTATAWTPPDDEVVTKKLIVTDQKGRDRMRLETSEDGQPRILLLDDGGNKRMTLSLVEGGSVISLSRSEGPDLILSANLHGDSQVGLFDGASKVRIAIICPKSGKPVIRFYDEQEKPLGELTK